VTDHLFTLKVHVDDDKLQGFDRMRGDDDPPPKDVSEWDVDELLGARGLGIATIEAIPQDYEQLPG
jgi:hypothetical protein